ncbi:MAG: PfkB family carbohydrate kinase [Bacteroidota bacterium]
MAKQLPDFSDLRILVIGDVMIDRYLRGEVNRISPEAPVPVVHLREEENRLGGAANVILNIQALGAEAIIGSVIGQDTQAAVFASLMEQQQLSTSGLLKSKERQTTVKTRVIAQNQQLLRADREDTHYLSPAEEEALLAKLEWVVSQQPIDLILLQDYNKGVLSEDFIEAILFLTQQAQIPTAVDPKKDNFWAYKKVDLFKPNLPEIQQQVDFRVTPTLADLDKADTYIRQQLDNRYTMITLASHGVYVSDGESSAIYPTQPRQIADVSGAGDTVISVAACGLAKGMPLSELAILANLAGGQVIEKPGVVAVDRHQLATEYRTP